MTKTELAYKVKQNILDTHLNLKRRDVNHKMIVAVLDSLFEELKVAIAKGEHIELRGFGTFERRLRKPKKAINPRTKEAVQVDEHAVCVFRPGKELKTMVKNGYQSNQ